MRGGLVPLVRYQAALLLRSNRWLPPLLLYAGVLAVGVSPGEPVLDSLGTTAAALLPAAAWLVRVCVTAEPAAARACTAAAAGPARAHLASLLTALAGAVAAGAAATGVVVAVSGRRPGGSAGGVPLAAAAGSGLLAVLTCALLGVALGALGSRPVLPGRARSLLVTVVAAVALLVGPVSPANAAVRTLVTGSRQGAVTYPVLPCAAAAALVAGAAAVACRAARRGG